MELSAVRDCATCYLVVERHGLIVNNRNCPSIHLDLYLRFREALLQKVFFHVGQNVFGFNFDVKLWSHVTTSASFHKSFFYYKKNKLFYRTRHQLGVLFVFLFDKKKHFTFFFIESIDFFEFTDKEVSKTRLNFFLSCKLSLF